MTETPGSDDRISLLEMQMEEMQEDINQLKHFLEQLIS
jgi:hypothetical protein